MRPDEHKKKRSAQYKKKHGDKVDKPKSTKQTSTQKTAAQNDAQKSATAESSSSRTDSPKSSATGRERESEQLDEWEQQKSYRRRQVVSNWERYEGTTSLNEDAPMLRGADFKAIIEAGGDAFSQFRFRDEQLWEAGEDVEAGSDDTPECLAIDCDQLAAALLCLPLHERLSIDKAAFLEDQIVQFDVLAKTNQAAYKQRQHEVTGKTDPGNASVCEDNVQSTSPDNSLVIDRCSESSQSEDILDDILRVTDASHLVENILPDSDSREHELRQTPIDDDNTVKDSVALSDSPRMLEHKKHRASGDCRNATHAEPTQKTANILCATITEPVLRNKLATTAETVFQKDNIESNVLNNDEPQKSISGIEDELDFLLTLEVCVSKGEKSTQLPDSCDTGNSDSLDDWLDDMIAS